MALTTYSTGTVSVSAGGAVTVAGGIWSGPNVVAGDMVSVDGGAAVLLSDVSDVTHGQLVGWTGGAVSGKPYVAYKCSALRFDDVQIAQDLQKQVAALNAEGFYIFVPSAATAPDPSLGDNGQYAFQATTGKLWVKDAGLWGFLGIYKGFGFKGAWSSATAYTVNDVVTLAGSSYIAIAASTNQTPPNATYWVVLAAKGDIGATGATGATPLKPIAAWATATAYVVGPPASYVSQGGSSYQCLIAHTSGTFSTDLAAGKWGLVAQKGSDGTGVGDVVAANYASEYTGHGAAVRANLGFTATGEAVAIAGGAGAAMAAIGGIDASSPVAIAAATTLTSAAFGRFHVISGTSANYTVTLPTPVGNAGKSFWVQVAGPAAASKLYTLSTPAGTIDGQSSRVMWASESALLWSDGTNWFKLFGRSIPFAGYMTRNTDQSIVPGTTWQGVDFTAAGGDYAGLNLADAGGYLLVPRTGVWSLNYGGMILQSGAPTFLQTTFFKSGGGTIPSWNDSANLAQSYINYSGLISAAAGDYLQVMVRANGTTPYVAGSVLASRLSYVETPLW